MAPTTPIRPTRPLTRDDLDQELAAFESRVMTEVDRRMSGQNAGLTAVVKALVEQSVAASIAPFRDVLEFARREMIRREVRREELDELGTLDKLIDGSHRRKTATRVFIWSVVVGLGTLGAWSALSRWIHF
jgi:hypothetical protein